jgi:hypothetical protein
MVGARLQVAFNCCTWSLVLGGSITCPCIGMSSWAWLFLSILISAYCLFFRLIRSERPRYLYSEFSKAHSSRTANFIVPNVCPRGSVLVRGFRLWNGLPLVIKESRSVAISEGALLARLKTV